VELSIAALYNLIEHGNIANPNVYVVQRKLAFVNDDKVHWVAMIVEVEPDVKIAISSDV
jgi:hypothetical protein